MNIHNTESLTYYLFEKKYRNREKLKYKRSIKEEQKYPERLDTLLSLLTAPEEKRRSISVGSEKNDDRSGLMPPEEGVILTSAQKRISNKNGYIPGVVSTSTMNASFV